MKKLLSLSAGVLLSIFLTCPMVAAQTTAFTYQGSLNTGGSPANGNHDFEFALFDALVAGSQLGSPTNKAGEIEGVKYDRVGVVLVNAVKEQQARIESQQKQIDKQDATIKLQQELLASQQAEIKRQQTQFEAFKKFVCSKEPGAELCRLN